MNKFSSIMLAISLVGTAHADYSLFHHSLLNSWTGLYVGANAGFASSNAQLRSQQLGFTHPNQACDNSSDFSTFFPGVQLGYLQQLPNNLVSGIEATIMVNTHQKNTFSCNCDVTPGVSDNFSFRNSLQGSIKGRVGRAVNWNKGMLLPYLTAGASFADMKLTYQNEGNDYYSKNTIQAGWLIGTGVEWAFRQNWSLRLEYSYIDYGNAHLNIPSVYGLVDPNGSAHVDLSSSNVVLAINYWI